MWILELEANHYIWLFPWDPGWLSSIHTRPHPTSTAFYLGTGKSWRIPSILNHLSRLILILKRMIWFPSDPLATIVMLSQKNTAKWRAPWIGKQMGPGLHWHVKPVCVLTGGVGFHVEKPTKKPGMTWPCLYPLVAMETAWKSPMSNLETSSHLQGLNPAMMFSWSKCFQKSEKTQGGGSHATTKKTLTFHPTGCLSIGILISWFIFFPTELGSLPSPIYPKQPGWCEFYNFTNLVVSSTPKWTPRTSPTPEPLIIW